MNELAPRYGNSAKGIGFGEVSAAADELLRAGERPTVRKVRNKVGKGSPNTINPLLDEWWKRLASRLNHAPASLHRLPEPVLHIAEAFWLRALDAARGRAVVEQALDRQSIDKDLQRFEVRSHVLSMREAEMESRLEERDKTIFDLETRLQLATVAVKRERAERNELLRMFQSLEVGRRSTKARASKRRIKKRPSKASKGKITSIRSEKRKPRKLARKHRRPR